MKKAIGALLAAAVMTVSANAAVTVTGTVQTAANGGYAASAATVAGSTLFDFDNAGALLGTSNGFTFGNNNINFGTLTVIANRAQINSGNTVNSSAPVNDATNYLTVLGGGSQSMLSANQSFNTLALYWGTPDTFNTIDLLDQAGASIATIGAADIAGLSAQAGSSALVTLSASQNFYGAKFNSTGNSFELDNVRFSNVATQTPAGTSTSAVPEPATWAMMIIGFGAIGFVTRRRPANSKAFAI